jgi:hypothetical protein
MAERPRLSAKAAPPPRPKLSEAALLNGWEKQLAASDNMIYRVFLVCYNGAGYVQEKHGFKSEADAYDFARVHRAPMGS